MKNNKLMPILAVVTCLVTATSAFALEKSQSGFLRDYAQLREDSDGAARYVNSGRSLAEYNKFILEPVAVYLPEGKAIYPGDLQALAQYFRDKAVQDLTAAGYQVVDHSGPGVLRIRAAITDIEVAKKAFNVHPLTKLAGIGTGGAAMEAEAVDSMTGERIIAVVDARQGDRMSMTEGLDTYGHARQAMDQWVARFVQRLNASKGQA
jgi:hypothetical protein